MFRSIFCTAVMIFYTVLYGTIGIILTYVKPSRFYDDAARPWGRSILGACGVKVEVEGTENIPKGPSIIMYNHQSSADIFAFSGYLPVEWKTVVKRELYSTPFLGWVLRVSGHYFVDRDGSSRDTKEVRRLTRSIKSGTAVLIAPEGTRSEDGRLLPFKKGGFLVAMQARVPVVPMVILGGKEVMPKGRLTIDPGSMKIKILKPIDVNRLPAGREGREELMRLVREKMETALGQGEGVRVAL